MQSFGPMINIILLAFFWGPSFLFIKLAVGDGIPPITLVALRIGLSALLFLIIIKIKKISLPRDLKTWKHCFFMGFFASSLPFILYGYSLIHIDSILSALINGTTPITTVLLAHYFLKEEPLTLQRIGGVVLGFAGFLTLFAPSLWLGNFSSDVLGMLLSFGAASCYAIGMVYARKNIKLQGPALVLPTLQCLTSLIYLIPLSLWIDPPLQVLELSMTAVFSVCGLAMFGTVFAFIIYYHIVMRYGATALSTTTYILPIFSALFGVVFLDEVASIHFCIATVLILLGTMVANNVIRLPLMNRKTAG